jgi:glutamine synthetase
VFSFGIGNRASSIRIPTTTAAEKKGYIEDRRPASDMDPYVVASALVDGTLLKESKLKPLFDHYMQWREWYKSSGIDDSA